MAGKVTLGEVSRGEVDIVRLARLNSLLDYKAAFDWREAKKLEKARDKR